MIKEIDLSKFKRITFEEEAVSCKVSPVEMERFADHRKKLASKIGLRKLQYEMDHQLSSGRAYTALEEACQIPVDTMKKTINGRAKPTRTFVYKFTVGLHMPLEEANEYFRLCGGELQPEDCAADYICAMALKDGDDIYTFLEDFQEYTETKIEIRERRGK